MSIPILIVNSDPRLRRMMRQSLEGAGYATIEADDAESGLELLRASEGGMVVLFNVILFNNIMTGTDGIALLGAAACDRRLAHQHAFVLVTPTPAQVEMALGRLLDHLAIPLLGEPFNTAELLRMVGRAAQQMLISA